MSYTIEEARRLRAIIEQQMQGADDATALEATTLYPHWAAGVHYSVGYRVQFGGVLYSVLQEHDSQETWTPDAAPSLFAKVLIPDENVVPEWEQPDSTNPYMTGDRVMYEGVMYESTIDNNVWNPVEYPAGWMVVTEE